MNVTIYQGAGSIRRTLMWWWHWAASRARPPTGLPSATAATAGENLSRAASAIEAAQAWLSLYAEGVQCEGDDVVRADEHRHLDELARVEV